MKKKILAMLLVFSLTISQVSGVTAEKKFEESIYNDSSIEEIADSLEEISNSCGVDIENKKEEVPVSEVLLEMDKKPVETKTIVENGVTYYIETYYEDGKKYVKTYSEKMDNVSIITVDDVVIDIDVYELNDSETKYDKISIEIDESDITDERNLVVAQSIKYNSKVKCSIGDYYYQTGNNGKKTYLKIGCSADYRIRTDNLTATKSTKCSNYQNDIKKCNSYHAKGNAYIAGTGISAGVIYAIIAANIVQPETVIITAIIAVVGGGATIYKAIDNYIDAYEQYLDAKDEYNIIKTYGTKL